MALSIAQLEWVHHSNGAYLEPRHFFGRMFTFDDIKAIAEPAGTYAYATRLLSRLPEPLLTDVKQQISVASASAFNVLRENSFSHKARASVPFSSSLAIGAEADVVIGSQLLDISSTQAVRTLYKKELQRLACYVLLDTENTHDIQEVGIYRSRNGHLFTNGVECFFEQAGAKVSIPTMREIFYERVLQPLAPGL